MTNATLDLFINRYKFISSVASESGNYPIHEIMLMYAKDGVGCDINIIHIVIELYPEALTHYNKNGFIPLHCLLARNNVMPNALVLSVLINYNIATAG